MKYDDDMEKYINITMYTREVRLTKKGFEIIEKPIKFRACNENDYRDERSKTKFRQSKAIGFGDMFLCPDNRSEIILEGMIGSSWFKLRTFEIKI